MPGLQSKFATRLTRFHGQQGPGFQGRYKARWSRTPPISPGSAITSLSIPFAPELSPPTGWANNGAAASGPACQCNCVMDTSGRRRIAEQTPLTLPASDPTRLVPVRRTVAVSRTRDPKRSLAPIPRPFGKHRGNARRRSHSARRLFWRLGDWPSRRAEGERPPTRPAGVVTGNVRHGDRRNQVRAVATGAGRRVQRSRQVFRGRGKRAKRRRLERRHRPDAANPGGRAVSLDRDAIAEASSRRRARRSLAADIAISGLTPSDRHDPIGSPPFSGAQDQNVPFMPREMAMP